MAGNAALLIDLENFYIGREDNYQRAHPQEIYEFAVDLDLLCEFAEELAAGRRLVVERAYANFNDRRPGEGERRWNYYLQPLPRFLMEQGIEPVQVFRFPGGSNKNAADMRLAMDATALQNGAARYELFILVTGDSDFIPLVLELKRSGAEVVVIGVANCTKPIFARYCDRFEYFEDLVAARELEREESSELDPIRRALHRLLERKSPVKFAAVKPLLANELTRQFDPSAFKCETTGDFLRRFSGDLGIQVSKGEHDWEIRLAAAPGAGTPAGESGAPAEMDVAAPGEPAAGEADPAADLGAAAEFTADAAAPAAHSAESPAHTAALYRDLLRQGVPRCYVVEYSDWRAILDAIFRAVTRGGTGRAAIFHQELLADVTESCAEAGVSDAGRKVRDVAFQLFKAGCFHCAEEGSPPGVADFHWARAAILDPALADVDAVERRTRAFLIRLLARRLEQRGMDPPIRTGALAELFSGPEPEAAQLVMLEELVRADAEQVRAAAGGERAR